MSLFAYYENSLECFPILGLLFETSFSYPTNCDYTIPMVPSLIIVSQLLSLLTSVEMIVW